MKTLNTTIILWLLCFSGFAQNKGLLWEISKEGYYTSYLFGTIHLNHNIVLENDSVVLAKISECSAYAGEIILQEEDMIKMMGYIFEKDSAKQCQNIFTKKELKEISLVVEEKKGAIMAMFVPRMSPYIVATILSIPDELGAASGTAFLDIYLQNFADSIGLALISLESVELQMAYLTNIPIEEQKAHLLNIVNDIEKKEEETNDIVEIYKSGDLQKIEDMVLEMTETDPIMNDDFMIERNIIHKNGMVNAMKQQATFTAVGVAHLAGEQGIISLLRGEGFSVKNVGL